MKASVILLASAIALFTIPALACEETPPPPPPKCDPCELSEKGLALIKYFEGFRPYPYRDSAGLLTIGFGHLMRPGENIPVPLLGKAASDLLKKDAAFAVRGVNRLTTAPLKMGQFSVLVSFTFNLGEGAYKYSTLRKRVNSHAHDDVPYQLSRWVYVTKNGQKLKIKGLERRRKIEGKIYRVSTERKWLGDILF